MNRLGYYRNFVFTKREEKDMIAESRYHQKMAAIADAVAAIERGDFEGWDNAMARAEQLVEEVE